MLVVKIIKKLQSLALRLKNNAIKKQVHKLEVNSDIIDVEYELHETRVELSHTIQIKLEERANNKLASGLERANEVKERASHAIDELNSL